MPYSFLANLMKVHLTQGMNYNRINPTSILVHPRAIQRQPGPLRKCLRQLILGNGLLLRAGQYSGQVPICSRSPDFTPAKSQSPAKLIFAGLFMVFD